MTRTHRTCPSIAGSCWHCAPLYASSISCASAFQTRSGCKPDSSCTFQPCVEAARAKQLLRLHKRKVNAAAKLFAGQWGGHCSGRTAAAAIEFRQTCQATASSRHKCLFSGSLALQRLGRDRPMFDSRQLRGESLSGLWWKVLQPRTSTNRIPTSPKACLGKGQHVDQQSFKARKEQDSDLMKLPFKTH